MRAIRSSFALAVLLAVSIAGGPARGAATITHHTVASSADGTIIAFTSFVPEGDGPFPVILHSHGWAGSRSTSGMETWTDDGFAVVSIDQRGHGASGGQANVEDPDLEGQDIKTVIDFIAAQPWVALDAPGDPVMAAIGGSYGGGYQTITALTEVRDFGYTRFNALAPEITWNNLPRSLGPNGVPRTLWDTLLYAVGIPMIPTWIHEGQAIGLATATFPDGSIPGTVDLEQIFYEHSPDWFADNGYQLDIPVLFRQGTSDNLFPLNEAWHNYEEVLTPEAKAKSLVVGYNGGHVLPSVVPAGVATAGDACSGDWTRLRKLFFTAAFSGGETKELLPATYNITAIDGTSCLHTERLDNYLNVPLEQLLLAGNHAGLPLQVEVARGPLTLAGIPKLEGRLTTLGVEARSFFALAVGTSPADAQILQNNVMPLRQAMPVSGERFSLELAGVGAQIPEGQSLFLTMAPATDMFLGMGSRIPAAIVIDSGVLRLPVI